MEDTKKDKKCKYASMGCKCNGCKDCEKNAEAEKKTQNPAIEFGFGFDE
jgi:hypothetical protein